MLPAQATSASVPTGSNNFSVTPVPTAPTTPQDLTVTPGNRTLTLSWEEPADDGGTTFTGYTIENRCGTVSRFSPVSGSPQPHNTARAVQTITIRWLGQRHPLRRAGSGQQLLRRRPQQLPGQQRTDPVQPLGTRLRHPRNIAVRTNKRHGHDRSRVPANLLGTPHQHGRQRHHRIQADLVRWNPSLSHHRQPYHLHDHRLGEPLRLHRKRQDDHRGGRKHIVVRQRQHTTPRRTRSAKKRCSQHSTAADQRQYQRQRRHKPGSHLGCTAAQRHQPGRRLCRTAA